MAASIFIFTGIYTKNLDLFETFVTSPKIRTNLEWRSICFYFLWRFFSSHCIYCIFSTVIFFALLERCDLRKECTIKVEKIKQKLDKWKTFFVKLFGKNCPKCKYFFHTSKKMAGFQLMEISWKPVPNSFFPTFFCVWKTFWTIFELYKLLVRKWRLARTCIRVDTGKGQH